MRLKHFVSMFFMLFALSVGQVWADNGSITFDFEADGAHRSDGSNSYTGSNVYTQNNCSIACTYMDVVTTGTPLQGSANALGRIAKKTTNAPILKIGPIDMSNKTITGISYKTKGVSAMSQVCAYSTNNTKWDTIVTVTPMPTQSTLKSSGTLSVTGTQTFYIQITTSVTSATSSNRDLQIDSVVVEYSTSGGGQQQQTPSLSLNPTSKEFAATGNSAQTIGLTASNFASAINDVTLAFYSEAACTNVIDKPTWVTTPTVNDAKTQVSVNVANNDGATRQTWMKVTASDGSKSASAVFNIKQAKYEAPFAGSIMEITKDSFATGGYNKNDNGITVEGFDFAVKDMYQNSGIIQAKASSGYIYNESVFGEIVKIEITKSGAGNNNFTVYEGTSEHPLTTSVSGDVDGTTTTYEFSEDQTYFTLKNGSTYSTVNPIKIYYYPIKSAVTIDNSIVNGSVGVTGAVDLTQVAVGTELTLSNTPDASYKLEAYDVYKTGDATTKVTVTDGKFTMPAYAVTVSGSFELARDLTSIAISAEASKKTYLVDETFSSEGLEITASFSNAADAVVTPTSISSPDMSSAGVKTITISYTEGANTETTSYDITVKDAYTVTEILPMVPALNAGSLATRVKGYISQIDQYNSTYKSITYWISVDGKTTSDQLEVYSGKNVGNTDFSSIDDLAVGDFVTISGEVKTYTNGVKEFDKNNYIITDGRIQKGAVTAVVVSGTPTKTAYSAGDAFAPAGLVVTATYASGYAVNVASELAAADWSANPATVTEAGNISVTATYGEQTSEAYNVPVTVLAATLESITLSYDAVEVYQGKPLPKPVVTAHWSDNTTSDVTALANFTGYVASTVGEQEITVSYQFGTGDPKEEIYTVTVNPIYGVELAASVAKDLIETVVGNTESTSDMIVRGKVSQVGSISSASLTYYISDDGTTTNQLEIFKGKYLSNADFTNDNKLKVGDEVVVTGKVIYYNSNTAEFANGKSQVTSLARTPNFTITDIASFEVGTADLAVADLTITQDGEGAVTLASSDNTDAVTIVDGKLHAAAAGDATITANLAANGIYKAATAEFNVTVIPATIKYAITFDGNGADGGSAPDAIADKAAGAEVTLPSNSYTKTGFAFDGWKVYDENDDEVTVTAGAFEMPASPVTIKAQWEEIPVWAYTYTSNVELEENSTNKCYSEGVTISSTDYSGLRIATGSAAGSATITVPAHATKLHFHVAGWKDVNGTIDVKSGESTLTSITLVADGGINQSNNNTAPYVLENNPIGYYYSVVIPDSDSPTDIKFVAPSGKRAVLFGVNQEGGVLPVLDHIAISGDLTTKSGYKTGDDLDLDGLTVEAIYTLGGVEQTPVNITNEQGLTLTYDPLVVDQTEVTITASYEDKSDNIVITLDEAVVSGDPEISTDVNSRSWTVEKDAAIPDAKTFAVTLKNIASATVTLGGDNPEAFNVSPSTLTASGNITVSVVSTATVNTYSATITIKDDASETSKTVNVNLTVNAPVVEETAVSTTSEWVAAEAADLVDGAEVLITGVTGGVTYAIGVQNGNNRAAVAGTLSEGVFTPGENTMSFTLVAQEEEGVFALQASNGEYLYAASSAKNYLKRQATLDDNAKWTLTATSAVANGSNTHNDLKFNATSSPKIFSCYANGQTAIQLYVPYVAPTPSTPDYVRDVTSGQMGTICLPNAVAAGDYTGATMYSIAYKTSNPVSVELVEENEGLVAGRPYIFIANANKIEVNYTGDATEELHPYHGLYGCLELMVIDYTVSIGGYTKDAYMLSGGKIKHCGANCTLQANRAYIVMDNVPEQGGNNQQIPGRRYISLMVEDMQTPTALDEVTVNQENAKFILNGQLYILRDGKLYNAQGQLVK